jgi:hypothetical protein
MPGNNWKFGSVNLVMFFANTRARRQQLAQIGGPPLDQFGAIGDFGPRVVMPKYQMRFISPLSQRRSGANAASSLHGR